MIDSGSETIRPVGSDRFKFWLCKRGHWSIYTFFFWEARSIESALGEGDSRAALLALFLPLEVLFERVPVGIVPSRGVVVGLFRWNPRVDHLELGAPAGLLRRESEFQP